MRAPTVSNRAFISARRPPISLRTPLSGDDLQGAQSRDIDVQTPVYGQLETPQFDHVCDPVDPQHLCGHDVQHLDLLQQRLRNKLVHGRRAVKKKQTEPMLNHLLQFMIVGKHPMKLCIPHGRRTACSGGSGNVRPLNDFHRHLAARFLGALPSLTAGRG